jgi:UDP-N-acetylmuramyl tripeptide synthase
MINDIMKNKIKLIIAINIGKFVHIILRLLGKWGTAFPGKIALKIYPEILKDLSVRCDKIVITTGTNGKTTTNNLIFHLLEGKYDNVVSNLKGSNMIQGIVSSFIVNRENSYEWGVFEVDEGSISAVTKFVKPDYMILTNFFRDQLDRFGEVDNTVQMVFDSLAPKTTLIINADDPSNLKFKDIHNKKIYYGVLENQFSKKDFNVSEAIFCQNCGTRLKYDYVNYGNLGKYKCEKCNQQRELLNYSAESIAIKNHSYEFIAKIGENFEKFNFNYIGIYNIYNCMATISFAFENKLDYSYVKKRIENFDFRLGRMETFNFSNKKVILVLSKNPVGLSEVLSTIVNDNNKKSVMFVLNDEPADGQDISWIYDADIEQIANDPNINKFYASGTRSYEVLLRLKYGGFPMKNSYKFPKNYDLKKELVEVINDDNPVSYIIGTFTAVPKIRKILVKKNLVN